MKKVFALNNLFLSVSCMESFGALGGIHKWRWTKLCFWQPEMKLLPLWMKSSITGPGISRNICLQQLATEKARNFIKKQIWVSVTQMILKEHKPLGFVSGTPFAGLHVNFGCVIKMGEIKGRTLIIDHLFPLPAHSWSCQGLENCDLAKKLVRNDNSSFSHHFSSFLHAIPLHF